MIKNAEKRAESIIKSADQKVQKEMEKVEKLEEKLLKKEEKLEQKIEELEAQKQKLKERELEMEKLINEQKLKLSEIAGLTPEQAKQILLRQIEKEYEEDLKRTIAKWKKIKQEEAQKEAAQILTKVLPRVASDVVSEFTVTTIDLPEESVK
jgi:ribonuclease Y